MFSIKTVTAPLVPLHFLSLLNLKLLLHRLIFMFCSESICCNWVEFQSIRKGFSCEREYMLWFYQRKLNNSLEGTLAVLKIYSHASKVTQ